MPEVDKPVPDPTRLTTEQLLRETEGLKELVASELSGLEGVFVERLESVNTQFQLIERQRVEQKQDTKAAVDAALAAAKEAVAKNEEQTKEQIGGLLRSFDSKITALENTFNDWKERVIKLESVKQGVIEQRTEQRAVVSEKREGISGITGLIAIGIAVLAFVGFKVTDNNNSTPVIIQPTPVTTTTTP